MIQLLNRFGLLNDKTVPVCLLAVIWAAGRLASVLGVAIQTVEKAYDELNAFHSIEAILVVQEIRHEKAGV